MFLHLNDNIAFYMTNHEEVQNINVYKQKNLAAKNSSSPNVSIESTMVKKMVSIFPVRFFCTTASRCSHHSCHSASTARAPQAATAPQARSQALQLVNFIFRQQVFLRTGPPSQVPTGWWPKARGSCLPALWSAWPGRRASSSWLVGQSHWDSLSMAGIQCGKQRMQ